MYAFAHTHTHTHTQGWHIESVLCSETFPLVSSHLGRRAHTSRVSKDEEWSKKEREKDRRDKDTKTSAVREKKVDEFSIRCGSAARRSFFFLLSSYDVSSLFWRYISALVNVG